MDEERYTENESQCSEPIGLYHIINSTYVNQYIHKYSFVLNVWSIKSKYVLILEINNEVVYYYSATYDDVMR